MKISIAMTTYNGAKYIKQQLDSLISQVRKADEVIIIDDCSSDGTDFIVESFLETKQLQNWYFTKNEHRLGYINNFNKAIGKCTGDVILLCDQDDIWEQNKISYMEEVFLHNSYIKVLASSVVFVDEQGDEIDKNFPIYDFKCVSTGELRKIDVNQIFEKNCFPGCSIAIRKELALKYLEEQGGDIEHDWALCLFGAVDESFYWLNDKLIRYRIHNENTVGLPRIRFNYFKYICWILSTWKLYIIGLNNRAIFLKKIDRNNKYMADVMWAKNRYASVIKKRFSVYLKNLILWMKLVSKYDKRGILLDLLSMIVS